MKTKSTKTGPTKIQIYRVNEAISRVCREMGRLSVIAKRNRNPIRSVTWTVFSKGARTTNLKVIYAKP